MSYATLQYLSLILTTNCNLNCIHCYVNGGNKKIEQLDNKTINKIINDAKNLGVKAIYLSGGEPLLMRNIYEIIENINKKIR